MEEYELASHSLLWIGSLKSRNVKNFTPKPAIDLRAADQMCERFASLYDGKCADMTINGVDLVLCEHETT